MEFPQKQIRERVNQIEADLYFQLDYPEDGPKILGPYDHFYDVQKFAVDPNEPTIAMYNRSLVTNAHLLSETASRMRRRGERVANFVITQMGMYADQIVEDKHGSRMQVTSGYVAGNKGEYNIFDQPEQPLPVTLVDVSEPTSDTMKTLVKHNIALLRPNRALKFDDKWLAKQRLQAFGIKTPDASLYDLSELEDAKDHLPEKFVIKPRKGLVGTDVYLFNDGMDSTRFSEAISEMQKFYDDAMVEEYLDSPLLRLSSIPTEAAFNIRAVVFNGLCGAYSRVHDKNKPGNVYQDASVLSMPKLLQTLKRQHGLDPESLRSDIETCAGQIGLAFPNTLLGADIMLDKNGNANVIEVNVCDFGAFNIKGYSKKDLNRALEITVRKLTDRANSLVDKPVETAEFENVSSIVDHAERLYTKLNTLRDDPRFMDSKGETDFVKMAHSHKVRKLLNDIYEAFEERRLAGDIQHCVPVFNTLKFLGRKTSNKKLEQQAKASLDKIANTKVA